VKYTAATEQKHENAARSVGPTADYTTWQRSSRLARPTVIHCKTETPMSAVRFCTMSPPDELVDLILCSPRLLVGPQL